MGDIDIVISHQNDVRTIGFLSKLLDQLQTKGRLMNVAARLKICLSSSLILPRFNHAPFERQCPSFTPYSCPHYLQSHRPSAGRLAAAWSNNSSPARYYRSALASIPPCDSCLDWIKAL